MRVYVERVSGRAEVFRVACLPCRHPSSRRVAPSQLSLTLAAAVLSLSSAVRGQTNSATPSASATASLSPPTASTASTPPATAANGASPLATSVARTRVSWVRLDGAEACPDVTSLIAATSERLGRDVAADQSGLSIEAVVSHDVSGWLLQLFVRGAAGASQGHREMRSTESSCTAIFEAAAFAIALSIDPDADPSLRPSSAASSNTASAARVSTANAAGSSSSSATAASSPVHTRLPGTSTPLATGRATLSPPRMPPSVIAARASFAVGLLPVAAIGTTVAGTLALTPALSFEFGMSLYPEVRIANDSPFAFGLVAPYAFACFRPPQPGRFEFAACGGANVGVSRASAHAPFVALLPASSERVWVAVSASPRLAVRIVRPLRIEFGVEAVVPVLGYSYEWSHATRESDVVFRQPWLALHAWAGLALEVP